MKSSLLNEWILLIVKILVVNRQGVVLSARKYAYKFDKNDSDKEIVAMQDVNVNIY